MRASVAGVLLCALLCATVFAAPPAAAQEGDAGDGRPESRLLMRLLDKVERLQAELREVRDRGDRQAQELRRLRAKVRALEDRPPLPSATTATTVAAVPAGAQGAPDGDARAAATPPYEETGEETDRAPPRDAPPAAPSDKRPPPSDGQRVGLLPKDHATPDEEAQRQAYQRATRAWNDDDYARLRQDLEVFLQTWPRGKYAANAKFWIGEAWYAERNLDEAERYYRRVTEENAGHHKSEDAYLKLAYIHIDREQWDAAAAVLQNLADTAAQDRIRALARKKLGQVQRER